jgi:cytosine/creatinine deaminase
MGPRFVELPKGDHFVVVNCRAPSSCLEGVVEQDGMCIDALLPVDVEVHRGRIASITSASTSNGRGVAIREGVELVDVGGGIIFPTFVDLHTHIGRELLGRPH